MSDCDFICRGCKIDAQNTDGKTAKEVAELNEQEAIVKLIEKYEKAEAKA